MAAPGIWSREFLVNSVTSNAQLSPVVAALADGRFAIAYVDYSCTTAFGFTDTSDTAIRVEIFNADASHFAAPIQVNTVATYYQRTPRIAALDDGGFVIAYSDLSIGFDSYDDDIWADAVRMQRFTGDGARLGPETRVNTTVYGDQDFPAIAALDTGQIVVAWDDGYWDEDENIFAQVFAPDGTRQAGELRLNQSLAGSQTGSEVAALQGGRYAVTWTQASGGDASGASVALRLFANDGTPLTGDIRVNTAETGDQSNARLAALGSNRLVVVWQDYSRGAETGGDDPSSYAVRGQVFDTAGARIGAEFRVNQTTANGQYQPALQALSTGGFVAAWCDTSAGVETGGDDPFFGAIRARIFRPDGTPAGDEFLVATTTTGHQNEPQIAELADGRLVFTWTDFSYGAETGGDDTSGGAIRARILDPRGTAATWSGTDTAEQFAGTIWRDDLAGYGGDDRLDGGRGDDTLSGGAGRDRLGGGAGNDRIAGDRGHDILTGGKGRDLIDGAAGRDTLSGNRGDDRLFGGGHADLLSGGTGADTLTGGRGADSFVFYAPGESPAAPGARDRITDFRPGLDEIDLAAIDANPASPEDDAFTFLGRAAFTGAPGELRHGRARDTTVVAADLDGDGRADMKIVFDGALSFHAADFAL